MTFSPRGDLVAWLGKAVARTHRVSANETTLVVLRAADGEVVFSTTFDGLIDDVAFDAGSQYVALRGADAIRVFDVGQGEETAAVSATAHAWFPVAAPAEESLPESLSERDTLQSVRSSNAAWRRRIDRDLTKDEWELYLGSEPYTETRASVSTRVRAHAAARPGGVSSGTVPA